ncbi:hypothetical protein PRIPAC_89569 [Pristionchus pacificus]|uniref:Uncharacterized protein n=1 Tax=Pristionchus pacificus TaxID=54126 RepID=A0A2A6B6M4_PRIPA|nr:hypothetical protein PRIPAC_89569 [Pristionchus pacificus]|eukprot:PDM61526.1 hypothetical protein PRIPAC_50968 [Pristionchus pacificus]
MSSQLRFFLLLVLLSAIAVSAAIFDDTESLEDSGMQMDKRNFQYIWRNLPIGSGSVRQLSDKRSMDNLSRDRASAFYRLG